jgi:hypothetical protein
MTSNKARFLLERILAELSGEVNTLLSHLPVA